MDCLCLQTTMIIYIDSIHFTTLETIQLWNRVCFLLTMHVPTTEVVSDVLNSLRLLVYTVHAPVSKRMLSSIMDLQ